MGRVTCCVGVFSVEAVAQTVPIVGVVVVSLVEG